jgi:hypothetical protein
MNTTEKLQELKALQARIDTIRHQLGLSAPGEVIYKADLDAISDDTLVVEADGLGGATTSVVAGNYPMDFTTKFEKFFPSESEAETAAEELACHRARPREILAASP